MDDGLEHGGASPVAPRTDRGGPQTAARQATGWRAARWARRAVQIVTFVLFVYLLFGAVQRRDPHPYADIFFRFDPLAAFGTMLAGREWLAHLALALVTVAGTILLGRWWCGWVCPMGTLLGWLRFRGAGRAAKRLPPRLRTVKYAVLVVIGVMAAFGSMTLIVLDPLSLLTRTATTALVPALDLAVTGLQRWMLQWPVFDPLVDWIEATFRGNALPLIQPRFDQAVALLLMFLAVVLLNALADRFWCRYLCPLGALLAWLSKLQVARPLVGDACTRCGACAHACRVGAIELPAAQGAGGAATARAAHEAACTARGGVPAEVVSSECTMCLDCLVACPEPGAMSFGLLRRPGPVPAYDPGRRHFLAAAGTGLGAVVLLGTGVWRTQESPALLRPPGVGAESRFLGLCLRCTECMKVCPTSGLQPALGQAGLEGVWSPILVPRIGYCDYGCNACGRVCPSGAIPELDLATKREQIIGIAVIDRDRCLPWAQDAPCIVCEEMCPTPQKAIELRGEGRDNGGGLRQGGGNDLGQGGGTDGRPARPVVIPELCIGCGICETKCPVSGTSAIVVERQAPALAPPSAEASRSRRT